MSAATVLAIGPWSVRVTRRAVVVAVGAILVLGVAILAALTLGVDSIAPGDAVAALIGQGTPASDFIVLQLRLPRVIVAALVGVALGIAGAVFQSVTRNPLGSPDVLGLSQGATAGALTVIVLFSGSATAVTLGALAGGLVTGAAIYLLARKQGVHGYRLVLVGIGVSAVVTAVDGYLITKADFVDAARAIVWMTGSLTGRGWNEFWPLLALCAVLVPLVLVQARALRATEMGDDVAQEPGLDVRRPKGRAG